MMKSPLIFEPSPHRDFTPLVREALCHSASPHFIFKPGHYNFHPTFALEHYVFVSNNDEGLKRIAFPLFGRQGVMIEGNGALFIFHGGIVPFLVSQCSKVCLRGFSLDWKIPFHGEAEVLTADSQGADVLILEGFSYRVENDRLAFGTEPFEVRNILAFDAMRRETAFLTRDHYGVVPRCVPSKTIPRGVRLEMAFNDPLPAPGDILAIMGERRDYPGIILDGVAEATLEDITIHHAGGMGIIAQRSEDITLRRVHVTPSEGRMISTTADATHFVHCRGHVQIVDCVFENQMDDAVNIHGIYAPIVESSSPEIVLVRLRHPQQFGATIARVGDQLELVRGTTLETFHKTTADQVEILNKEYVRLRLGDEIAEEIHPGDVLNNLTWHPSIEIRACRSRGNRARGFLLSSNQKTVIKDNEFHTPGAAILVASDAYDWFESGPVESLLIRGNRFLNCNYGIWGHAAIQILPRIAKPDSSLPRYHRNIRIVENYFEVFDARLIYARSVEGLEIEKNHILFTDVYPSQHRSSEAFEIKQCVQVKLHDNVFENETPFV